jgi:alkane 1-monooxygenase
VAGPSASLDTRLEARAPGAVSGLFLRHLTSLYIPAVSLLFLGTGPHVWYVAILFMWAMVVAHQLDCSPRFERRQPSADTPAWPFDGLVYLLAALQLTIVAWTVRLFTQQTIFSVDMVMVLLLIGGSSGFSIITAHELIHRKNKLEQGLGRLLLCSVLYEHFYTEHLRGHHVRVGTPEDPATARFGEAYEPFFRRTLQGQLRSAWRLETRRLGDPEMRLLDRRQLRNRVLHGIVVEWGLAVAILGFFGLASAVAFVLQAFMAVRLLEAVNYFEHWGLVRRSARVSPADSWDTHSWFTYYGLVGLSRHADHHAWPARPYQELRVFEEAPLLPIGYVGLVDLVMGRNQEFQQLATDALARRRLGPFAPEVAPEPVDPETARRRLAEAQAAERPRRGTVGAAWRRLPLRLRGLLLLAMLLGVASLGVQWEGGASTLGFAARYALHAWVLAVVVAAVLMARAIRQRWDHESFAFGLAFSAMAVLGWLTDRALSLA